MRSLRGHMQYPTPPKRLGRSEIWPLAALATIAIALAAGFLPVLWLGLKQPFTLFDPHTLHILTFTLQQALLSTLLSLALGIPAAVAIARRRFPGRNILISLLALPMALPQIVVVLGLIGLFGAQGWFANTIPLYGLSGILLAHVFFNATLVARLTFAALQSIPAEQFRIAAQLGLSDWRHFRTVDLPVLRQSLPGTALLVFLLCAASFTVVLTLGGPQATTLEAAVYLALRSDFDPARATALAMMQLGLCAILAAGVMCFTVNIQQQAALRLNLKRYDGQSPHAKAFDTVSLATLAILLVLPLATLVSKGLAGIAVGETFAKAMTTSFVFSTLAASTTCFAAYVLTHAAVRSTRFARAGQLASIAGLALPPAVIATGWFMLAVATTGLSAIAAVLIIALNTLVALPYAYGTLAPHMRDTAHHDRLSASLNISGWNRARLDLRALKRPLTLAFAMSFVLSLGDLAAVLFFGDGHYVTLPALIYQQMGSYRMQGATGTALVLAALSWPILFAAEKVWNDA